MLKLFVKNSSCSKCNDVKEAVKNSGEEYQILTIDRAKGWCTKCTIKKKASCNYCLNKKRMIENYDYLRKLSKKASVPAVLDTETSKLYYPTKKISELINFKKRERLIEKASGN